jgi:hypothetical protein
MSRPYVFLVHGVGQHPSDSWADGWRSTLVGELRRYAPFKSLAPEAIEAEHVRFVPIGYDAVFEGFRQRWGDLAAALSDNAVIEQSDAHEAIEWVAENSTTDNSYAKFFWEKALDALLWAAFPLARGQAIASVAEQLTRGIGEMLDENGSTDGAHCIAHSLGTSVLHDALVSLTFAQDIHQAVFDPAHFRWQSISMVANTSRLLRARKDLSSQADLADYRPYGSILRPGLPRSITHLYLNFRHQVDPITWPKMFDPFDWDKNFYSDTVLRHFSKVEQVHDFAHYVAHPSVHLALWRTILKRNWLGTKAEVDAVSRDYVGRHPNTTDSVFGDLKALIGGQTDRDMSAKQIVEFLVRAYKELS